MATKAVFLDRDGVLNRKMPDGHYVNSWDDLDILPGAMEAVRRLNAAGFLVFVVTNQRNVARKQISAGGLEQIHSRLQQTFAENGAIIREFYCCPHEIDEDCNCRKPQPGMLLRALREHNLDLSQCWMVGDSASDIEAGNRAGCRTIWITESKASAEIESGSALLARNLPEAAAQILDWDKAQSTKLPDQGSEPRPAVQASILLLTKNEAANIRKCLDAVFSQEHMSEFEVIAVDSGSSDGTAEILHCYPVQLHQISTEGFHHARTRNLVAELARGQFLVYLAADALPTSRNWLNSLLRNFDDETVGAVYGRHIPKSGARIERRDVLSTMYTDTRVVKSRDNKANFGYRYYHFSTVNCAIRRDVWEKTRFPEDYKVFEDVAIAKLILDGGWKIVYEPQAAVYHSHDFSTARLFKRYFDVGVVYRRLNIWDAKSKNMLRRDGLRSARSKLYLLWNGPGLKELGHGLCHDAAKCAGLLLGRNETLLPRAMKKWLSAFRLFD